jgi:hypothetical protein
MLGISHLTLLGSLTTDKVDPKDADVLVTVADNAGLTPLARFAGRLHGRAQPD